MKKYTPLFLFIVLLFAGGCAPINKFFTKPPEIFIKENIDINEIAVLTFSKQGAFLPPNIERFAADKLTDALFIKGRYSVIDRSKVNAAQFALGLNSPDNLSTDQIQMLGLKLKANYLALGRIQEYSGADYINSGEDKKLAISIRIISVLNSSTVGTINTTCTYTEQNSYEKIEKLISEIVAGLKPE